MKRFSIRTLAVSTGMVLLGLTLADTQPVPANPVKPLKTKVTCSKTEPCFEAANSAPGYGAEGIVQANSPTSVFPGPAGLVGIGQGNYETGVLGWGEGTGTVGLYGLSDDGEGGYFTTYGYAPTLYAISFGGGYPLEVQSPSGLFYVDVSGDGIFSGSVSASSFITNVRTHSGERVQAFAARSTRETIEETGTARLVNGEGAVRFDAALANAIDVSRGYQVLVTPDGDTRGLYVSAKYEGGFIVRETERGRSSLYFDYRVVAHPFGASDARLPEVNFPAPRPLPIGRILPRPSF